MILREQIDCDFKNTNQVAEVRALAIYLEGAATGSGNNKLLLAAAWLYELSGEMCGQGYIGCEGGEQCESDHK